MADDPADDPAASPSPTERRCTTCGELLEVRHRYCPQCGSPVGAITGAVGSGDETPDLLDIGGEPVTVEATVAVDQRGLLTRVAAAVGAVLVALLAWSLFRQPSDDGTEDEAAAEEAAEDDEAAAEDDAAEDVDDEDTGEDAEEVEDRPTSTDRPTTATGADADGDEADQDSPGDEPAPAPGPVAGEEIGLLLVVGSDVSGRIDVVDLDTGEAREIPIGGRPVGIIDSTLVLSYQGGTRLIDLDDPEPRQRGLQIPTGVVWSTAVGVQDDQIILHGETDKGPTVLVFDREGNLIEQGVSPAPNRYGYWLAEAPTGDVVSDGAGGVYQSIGDGYRQVADGGLLALGEDLALIRSCDERYRCTVQWYDTISWEVRDLPRPGEQTPSTFLRILGGDRWLVEMEFLTRPRARLIEIETGEVMREVDDERAYTLSQGTPFSADGRWMVEHRDGALVLTDLDREVHHPLPIEARASADPFSFAVSLLPRPGG